MAKIKTLQIDEELHREFKIAAALLGKPLMQATAEAVRAWIEDMMQQLQEQSDVHLQRLRDG